MRRDTTGIIETGDAAGMTFETWRDIRVEPVNDAAYDYLQVWKGKSKNAKRNFCLTIRVRSVLKDRASCTDFPWVFPRKRIGPFWQLC